VEVVNRTDYAIATTGSLVLHAALIVAAFMFSPSSNPLVQIAEPNIIHAQLVSIDDLKPPEQQPQQRVIDLTMAPPIAKVAAPDRLQVPTEPVAEVEVNEPDPEPEVPLEPTNNLAEERAAREEQELLQRQTDLASQLDTELGALQQIENQQIVMSYASWISERVGNNWSRPPSARSGMIVELRVNMVPTGRVVSVDIVDSSGNDAFDQSAVQAVRKAEPYNLLTELSPEIFDQQFRQFLFSFNPQDLRL
jgi:colicin import membrane protein